MLFGLVIVYCGLLTASAVHTVDQESVQGATDTLRVVAALLFLGAGALQMGRAGIIDDPHAALLGAAVTVFGALTFPSVEVARTLLGPEPDLGPTPVTPLLAALCTLALVAAAVWAPHVARRVAPHRLVVGAVALAAVLVVAVAVLQRTAHLGTGLGDRAQVVVGIGAAAAWSGLALAVQRTGPRLGSVSAPAVATALAALAALSLLRAAAVYDPGSWVFARAAVVALVAAVLAAVAGTRLFEVASQERASGAVASERAAGAESLLVTNAEWLEEMVHDARNTLAALRIASLTMSSGTKTDLDSNQQERLHGAMLSEIGHLEELMAHSRTDSLVDFDVEQVIRPTVEAQRAMGLTCRMQVSGVWVHGRPGDLVRVVQNLLVNARLHAGGSSVTIKARRAGALVDLLLADRGPGVPDDERERVFARGTHGEGSAGSGLGLHVARTLMRGQGGDLAMDDSPLGGAVFVLSLPQAAHRLQHHPPTTRRPTAPSDVPRQRSRVGLADAGRTP